jgi:hypothetical protein
MFTNLLLVYKIADNYVSKTFRSHEIRQYVIAFIARIYTTNPEIELDLRFLYN